jgi:hypothetical protein
MQDAELFASSLANNEQWFNQRRQVGQVFDKLPDTGLEPDRSHLANTVPRRPS